MVGSRDIGRSEAGRVLKFEKPEGGERKNVRVLLGENKELLAY